MKKILISGSILTILTLALLATPASAEEGREGRDDNRPRPMQKVMQMRRDNASGTPARLEDKMKRGTSSMGSANVDVTCMKNAIDKREAALVSNWTTFNTSLTSAISARGAALKAAFDKPAGTERKAALQTARKNFTNTVKAARKTFTTADKTTRATFRTEAKACGANGSDMSAAESQEDGAMFK